MKRLLFFGLFLVAVLAQAQVQVDFKIHHRLGSSPFALDQVATNNLGHDYKITRLQYYITKFSIVHDGGQVTAVSDDTVALVTPSDEAVTTIQLGEHNVTDVEGVKFHIGVHSPVNNEDPSLYPSDHPLAPKSPSMHWGWASGYRFLVYEGVGGPSFAQTFQLHGLGNENYFETSVDVTGFMDAGRMIISLNADYTRGVEDIDVSAGVISHGTIGEAKLALENFRDFVFQPAVLSTDNNASLELSVYPNPSNGILNVNIKSEGNEKYNLTIYNSIGQVVESKVINTSQTQVNLEEKGIYFVTILNSNGEQVSVEKVIVH